MISSQIWLGLLRRSWVQLISCSSCLTCFQSRHWHPLYKISSNTILRLTVLSHRWSLWPSYYCCLFHSGFIRLILTPVWPVQVSSLVWRRTFNFLYFMLPPVFNYLSRLSILTSPSSWTPGTFLAHGKEENTNEIKHSNCSNILY